MNRLALTISSTLALLNLSICQVQNGPPRESALIFFLGTECPISQYYASIIPDLVSLSALSPYSVFPNSTDKKEEIDAFMKKYRLTTEVILDKDQFLTRELDVTVTPEVFLLDSIGRIIYSGKIDDKYYSLGRHRYKTQEHYLRDAIKAYEAGIKVEVERVKPIGCFIQRVK